MSGFGEVLDTYVIDRSLQSRVLSCKVILPSDSLTAIHIPAWLTERAEIYPTTDRRDPRKVPPINDKMQHRTTFKPTIDPAFDGVAEPREACSV